MKFRLDIEKITRMQEMQLKLARAKSSANKKKWKYLRENIMTACSADQDEIATDEIGEFRSVLHLDRGYRRRYLYFLTILFLFQLPKNKEQVLIVN